MELALATPFNQPSCSYFGSCIRNVSSFSTNESESIHTGHEGHEARPSTNKPINQPVGRRESLVALDFPYRFSFITGKIAKWRANWRGSPPRKRRNEIVTLGRASKLEPRINTPNFKRSGERLSPILVPSYLRENTRLKSKLKWKKKKKKYFSEFLGRGYERKMKEGGRVIYKDDIFSAGSFQKLAFRVACSLVQSNRICMAIKLEYLSPAIKKKKRKKNLFPPNTCKSAGGNRAWITRIAIHLSQCETLSSRSEMHASLQGQTDGINPFRSMELTSTPCN